jgi:biopolymer transport protein TolR
MTSGSASGLQAEMNVTPMIDVLLVLLVVFMLMQQVRLVTPAALAEEGNGRPGTGQVVLELLSDGGYALNRAAVMPSELGATLAAVFAGRSVKVLLVSAAPNRRYQEVIGAMDVARGIGVDVVGIMPRQ